MEPNDTALEALARCIEYPSAGFLTQVEQAVSLMKRRDREAGKLLERFWEFLASVSLESAEEMHTQTFDLEPACCLYVGYHLFGDSHRRGIFMARLAEWYQSADFSAVGELPDHLTVLLRFLARVGEGTEKSELIEYCLMPVLERIGKGLRGKKSPYEDPIRVIHALVSRLKGGPR